MQLFVLPVFSPFIKQITCNYFMQTREWILLCEINRPVSDVVFQ